ncbi:hypothetical protein ABBQ38_006363 [Trebouxia sp. C0009 RCD-2024]
MSAAFKLAADEGGRQTSAVKQVAAEGPQLLQAQRVRPIFKAIVFKRAGVRELLSN